jgi:hypothetical protein
MRRSNGKNVPRLSGKWLRTDIPHVGWSCVEVRESNGYCSMCEITPIVYAHVMRHDRYPGELECGCVCAGFMAEDVAAEQRRELLYKWQRQLLAEARPVEKLRRKHWHSVRYRDYVAAWSYFDRRTDSSVCFLEEFKVLVSEEPDGFHYRLYTPSSRWNLLKSAAYASDLHAATVGIGRAEMLMGDPQWLAAECEAAVERWAAYEAERKAHEVRWAMARAREAEREDLCAAIQAGRLSPWDAVRQLKSEREARHD